MYKVLAMTGTRADYPRIRDVLLRLDGDPEIELIVGCTAQHLSPRSGFTFSDVYADFASKCRPYEMYAGFGDSPVDMSRAAAFSSIGFANLIAEEAPNAILLTVDRAETIAASMASIFANIPIFHVQGGELTGTVDEVLRHAVTKMSHVHFVANEAARKVVLQLGENPDHVHLTGCPYVDYLLRFEAMSKESVAIELGLNPEKQWVPFIYHPVTTEFHNLADQTTEILKFLEFLIDENFELVNFCSNLDAGSRKINGLMTQLNHRRFTNLNQNIFLSLLRNSTVMIGNSSSAIRECPYIPLPAINIGSRQSDRVHGSNIFNSAADFKQLKEAHDLALKASLVKEFPYGTFGAVDRIVSLIKSYLDGNRSLSLQKRFFVNA